MAASNGTNGEVLIKPELLAKRIFLSVILRKHQGDPTNFIRQQPQFLAAPGKLSPTILVRGELENGSDRFHERPDVRDRAGKRRTSHLLGELIKNRASHAVDPARAYRNQHAVFDGLLVRIGIDDLRLLLLHTLRGRPSLPSVPLKINISF